MLRRHFALGSIGFGATLLLARHAGAAIAAPSPPAAALPALEPGDVRDLVFGGDGNHEIPFAGDLKIQDSVGAIGDMFTKAGALEKATSAPAFKTAGDCTPYFKAAHAQFRDIGYSRFFEVARSAYDIDVALFAAYSVNNLNYFTSMIGAVQYGRMAAVAVDGFTAGALVGSLLTLATNARHDVKTLAQALAPTAACDCQSGVRRVETPPSIVVADNRPFTNRTTGRKYIGSLYVHDKRDSHVRNLKRLGRYA